MVTLEIIGMFYEKYKEAFESGSQLPFQKQIQDVRTLQSNIAKKNNVFTKNATNIITDNSRNVLNINTSLRLGPEKMNYASSGNIRGNLGKSMPSVANLYQGQSSAQRSGMGLVDRMPSARQGQIMSTDRRKGEGIKNHISAGLRDALSWNDEDNGSKFRALKTKAPPSYLGSYGRYEPEKPKNHDFLENLQRSSIDIMNVNLFDLGRQETCRSSASAQSHNLRFLPWRE